MEKVKIQVGYQYLGDKIGSIPFMDFKYCTEDNRELDALSALNERRSLYVVPNTHFFSGTTEDGQDFRVEKYADIPEGAIYPIAEKMSDSYDVDDYMSTDVEMIVKKLASQVCGSEVRYGYCNYENNSYQCSATKNLDDPELKNALISEIKLDYDKMVDLNISLEAKSLMIAENFLQMFDAVQNSSDYDISKIDFEIEGMKLDRLNSCENIEKVVQTILVNGSKRSVERVSGWLNSQTQDLQKEEYNSVSLSDVEDSVVDDVSMSGSKTSVFDDVSMSGSKISVFDDALMREPLENDHKIKATLKKGEYFTYGDKYFVEFEYEDEEAQEKMYKIFKEQLIPSYGSNSYRNSDGYEGDYIMPYLVDENGDFSVQNTNIIGGTSIPEDLLPNFIKRFVELDGVVVKIGDEEMKDYFYRDKFDQMVSKIDSAKAK